MATYIRRRGGPYGDSFEDTDPNAAINILDSATIKSYIDQGVDVQIIDEEQIDKLQALAEESVDNEIINQALEVAKKSQKPADLLSSKEKRKRQKQERLTRVIKDAPVKSIKQELESRLKSGKNLNRRIDEVKAIDATEKQLSKLGRLQGNVPVPVIKRIKDDLEERTFVEYANDDFWKGERIVGYKDPSNPNEILRLPIGNVGQSNLPGGHTKGAEALGEAILKLQGKKAAVNNQSRENGRQAYWRADLKDNTNNRNVDVEIRTVTDERGQGRGYSESVVPSQLYTGVIPSAYTQGLGKMMQLVEQEILARAGAHPNIVSAIESLKKDGITKDIPMKESIGKALKSVRANVDSDADVMHEILMPGYTREQADFGTMRGTNNEGDFILAPQNVQMVNNGRALQYIIKELDMNALKPGGYREGPLRMRAGFGDEHSAGQKGRARTRVYIDIPKDAEVEAGRVARDVLEDSPMVQQVLDIGAMGKRLVR